MRRIMVVALCFLFSSSCYSDIRLIDKSHFVFVHTISGIRIDFSTPIEELDRTLGEPVISYTKPNEQGYKIYTWEGLKLRVLPDNDIIIRITVSSDEFRTEAGIAVGLKLSAAISTYGSPSVETRNSISFLFSDMSETWRLKFTSIYPGTISLMEIGRED